MTKQSDEPSPISWEPLKTIYLREFHVDIEEIEEQLAARYPYPKDMWSWHIERTLSNHILIHVHIMADDPGCVHAIVWSKDSVVSIWDVDSWDKFAQLVENEGLSIADNLQDILDIFCFFQLHRRILCSVTDLEFVREEKRSILARYATSITPPTRSCHKGKQEARFWTIDYGFGNLEEWLFVQTETRLHVQSWVRVECLILTLGLY